MKERIAAIRKAFGLTQRQFGEQIGVLRQAVTNYERGRNLPTEAVRQMICRVYGVRREWLETGSGDMFEEKGRHEKVREIAGRHLEMESDLFRQRLISVISELSIEQLAVLAEIAEKIVGQ